MKKNEKMANYGSCRRSHGFFTSEMPSIRVECRAGFLVTHRIISSGKVVIYRISLVITGCQKRRLDESS